MAAGGRSAGQAVPAVGAGPWLPGAGRLGAGVMEATLLSNGRLNTLQMELHGEPCTPERPCRRASVNMRWAPPVLQWGGANPEQSMAGMCTWRPHALAPCETLTCEFTSPHPKRGGAGWGPLGDSARMGAPARGLLHAALPCSERLTENTGSACSHHSTVLPVQPTAQLCELRPLAQHKAALAGGHQEGASPW